MEIIQRVKEMQALADDIRREHKLLGFVPTMGYLHDGHLSLIRHAHKFSDVVVVSIFVNPSQFGPDEDYDAYPRDFERDRALCQAERTDYIFNPSVGEMYPDSQSYTTVTVSKLTDNLCGAFRACHFDGVTTVVAKLLNLVKPDIAVFGQKDGQQAFVIKRMVADLNFDVDIKIAPTVREEDGLAMSSRNKYLTDDERAIAPAIYEALKRAETLVAQDEPDPAKVIAMIKDHINKYDKFDIEYVQIVDTETLAPVEKLEGKVMIAVAAYLGKARLIDNIILDL